MAAWVSGEAWLPRRFSNLSGRLVTQDGVLAMGLAAAATLIGTRASVDLLVVLYAINVFITDPWPSARQLRNSP